MRPPQAGHHTDWRLAMNRSTRPHPVQGTTLMERLGGWSYRRRKLVVVTWVVMLVGLIALSSTAGGAFNTQFKLPGSESQEAIDLLSAHGFGDRAGAQGQIVFEAEQGIDDPAVRMAMEQFFAQVDATVPRYDGRQPVQPRGRTTGRRGQADRLRRTELRRPQRGSLSPRRGGYPSAPRPGHGPGHARSSSAATSSAGEASPRAR